MAGSASLCVLPVGHEYRLMLWPPVDGHRMRLIVCCLRGVSAGSGRQVGSDLRLMLDAVEKGRVAATLAFQSF